MPVAHAVNVSDPIALELLRSRLQAVAEEGAIAIERTAISPVITECRDYSCTLLDADASLVVAGGAITHHFGICSPAVRVTMAVHGDSIAPGDVFLSNDPHNGGGLHAQDVVVQMPVFLDDVLVGWVVNSGHLIDLGGMVFGSWSPDATECYQEALRFPPVRLFRRGVEQTDIFQILRTNVRVAHMVEMDLRSLVAGCGVAADKLVAIARAMGHEQFAAGVAELQRLSEGEQRRRIAQLADGEYRYTMWAEWHDEVLELPCAMTVDGDELRFDFEGAPPQSIHYFNTVPHIVTAIVVGDIAEFLTYDIPLNEGMFTPVTVLCPADSILDSSPPAPVASAHCDISMAAGTAAVECVMLAVAASPESDVAHLRTGPIASTSLIIQTWAYEGEAGPDGWLMVDAAMCGTSGSHDRDGTDLAAFVVARKQLMESSDIESMELAYPMLVDFKKVQGAEAGAGRFRSGSGCHVRFRPHGAPRLVGQIMSIRERLPLNGAAGGRPGRLPEFLLHGPDGATTELEAKRGNVVLEAGSSVEFRVPSGGGYGDPLDRDPGQVARDVRRGRLGPGDARSVYGVRLAADGVPDEAATAGIREEMRRGRLAAAQRASLPVDGYARPGDDVEPPQPLAVGVEQRGATAVAVLSGAVLAHSPGAWTDGCPRIESVLSAGIVERGYLDPLSGRLLLVEAVPAGTPCGIVATPRHWADPDA